MYSNTVFSLLLEKIVLFYLSGPFLFDIKNYIVMTVMFFFWLSRALILYKNSNWQFIFFQERRAETVRANKANLQQQVTASSG